MRKHLFLVRMAEKPALIVGGGELSVLFREEYPSGKRLRNIVCFIDLRVAYDGRE